MKLFRGARRRRESNSMLICWVKTLPTAFRDLKHQTKKKVGSKLNSEPISTAKGERVWSERKEMHDISRIDLNNFGNNFDSSAVVAGWKSCLDVSSHSKPCLGIVKSISWIWTIIWQINSVFIRFSINFMKYLFFSPSHPLFRPTRRRLRRSSFDNVFPYFPVGYYMYLQCRNSNSNSMRRPKSLKRRALKEHKSSKSAVKVKFYE